MCTVRVLRWACLGRIGVQRGRASSCLPLGSSGSGELIGRGVAAQADVTWQTHSQGVYYPVLQPSGDYLVEVLGCQDIMVVGRIRIKFEWMG